MLSTLCQPLKSAKVGERRGWKQKKKKKKKKRRRADPPFPFSRSSTFFSLCLSFFSSLLFSSLLFLFPSHEFVTKRGHAHADHVGRSQVIAYLWAARACGPSMSPLTSILTSGLLHHARGKRGNSPGARSNSRPIPFSLSRFTSPCLASLSPRSYRFIPPHAFKWGNDRLNNAI